VLKRLVGIPVRTDKTEKSQHCVETQGVDNDTKVATVVLLSIRGPRIDDYMGGV
jgi:hypothetical protein